MSLQHVVAGEDWAQALLSLALSQAQLLLLVLHRAGRPPP
jgi:hypothetical protein